MKEEDILNCRCDEGKYCEVHQSGCGLHGSLCPDEPCTCNVISKEESKRLKNQLIMKATNETQSGSLTNHLKELKEKKNESLINDGVTQGEWKVFDGQYPIGTISINKDTSTRIATINFGKDGHVKDYGEAKANAEHIVRCVNSHASLVAALQDIYYDDIESKILTSTQRSSVKNILTQLGELLKTDSLK